jgi:transposase-like protein
MDGVVEIITGRERRRRWSTAEKLRLVAETQEAGNHTDYLRMRRLP